MKTQLFIETVEGLGFKVIQVGFKNHDSYPDSEYEDVFSILKGDEKVIHVWLTEKWLVKDDYYGFSKLREVEKVKLMSIIKNDYYGFSKLSAVEKAELMTIVNKYVSTEKKDR